MGGIPVLVLDEQQTALDKTALNDTWSSSNFLLSSIKMIAHAKYLGFNQEQTEWYYPLSTGSPGLIELTVTSNQVITNRFIHSGGLYPKTFSVNVNWFANISVRVFISPLTFKILSRL